MEQIDVILIRLTGIAVLDILDYSDTCVLILNAYLYFYIFRSQ
jgi:hypothetical protein